jgi:ketopantoate hydroxymethyltransferase
LKIYKEREKIAMLACYEASLADVMSDVSTVKAGTFPDSTHDWE